MLECVTFITSKATTFESRQQVLILLNADTSRDGYGEMPIANTKTKILD